MLMLAGDLHFDIDDSLRSIIVQTIVDSRFMDGSLVDDDRLTMMEPLD